MNSTTQTGIDNYANLHVPPSGFLRAVFENDLLMAFSKADSDNKRDLGEIVKYVYNNVPGIAWGSKEKVVDWISQRV